MPEPIYVPVLKGKEGEYAALEALGSEIRSKLMPLIEVPAIPYDFASEAPAKSLDEHIAGIPARLRRACYGISFYLDLPWFRQDEIVASGRTALDVLLLEGATLGLKVVPVIRRSSPPPYLAAARSHSLRTDAGICVRLLVDDFDENVDLDNDVERLLSQALPEHGTADLILDLEDLGANAGRASLVARSIFSMIPDRSRWRRIILVAASFPEDLSEVTAATVVTLPRLEWDLWKVLQKKPLSLPRRDLIFGDYAMANPIVKVLDPRTMRMSANIRYTTQNDWLVLKGKNVRQYGFDQYFDLCRRLVNRPEYSKPAFSWGDRYIEDCANEVQGPGNATTWRKVGVNHHITLVTREIANLAAAV